MNHHIREIIRGASSTFVLKIFAAGLTFLFGCAVARTLGASSAGLFFLALTCVTIASVIARFGFDNTFVRLISTRVTRGDWNSISETYLLGIGLCTFASILASLLLASLAPYLAEHVFTDIRLTQHIQWLSIAILPHAMMILHAHALQGLKRVASSITVMSTLPAFATLALFIPLWYCTNNELSAAWAFLAGSTISATVGIILWLRATHCRIVKISLSNMRTILQSAYPLLGVTLCSLIPIWTPIIILGALTSSNEVAIYTIASRTATLVSHVLVASNSIAAPKYAMLFQAGKHKTLESTARSTTKITIALVTPIVLIIIVWAKSVMLMFGNGFEEGVPVLRILALGQFINVATGSVGYILMMSGRERDFRDIVTSVAICNLLLNMIFIPLWGSRGAALATLISITAQNSAAAWNVWKKLNISVIPIFLPRACDSTHTTPN